MKHLSRRTFLRGGATAIGLPLLEAMIPPFARAAAAAPPCRIAFVYVPNGIVMEQWTPPPAGDAAPLPEAFPRILEPLAPHRREITLLTGLTQDGGRAHGDGPGDHGRAGASYLTSVHPRKTFGKDIQTGVSVDQIAAQAVGSRTRFASLELGCEEGIQGGNCDNGYSCAYSNSISWRTPSAPNPPETRPRAVFERMFGAAGEERDPARRARLQRYDRSVLDAVLEDANRLKGTLGGTDRRKLDEYLFSIRDVEKRIAGSQEAAAPPNAPAPPPGLPADFTEHSRLLFDLMILAFQTDMTRIATFLMAIEQSNRNYREIGIPEAHHGLTHHRGDPDKIEKVTRINQYHVEQFAYFVGKLKSTPDGGGSLLDNVIVTYGSGLADGNRHEHHNLPLVLAGRGAGTLGAGGRQLRFARETPLANLHLTMLDRMGVPVDRIGDSNGKLESIAL